MSAPPTRRTPTLADLARTLRTLAHVRPGQIWHRVRYSLRRRQWERNADAIDARYRERAERLPALRWDHPGLGAVARYRHGLRSEEAAREIADAALEGHFRFLSRTESFGETVDWFRPDLDVGTRLWKTLLHEFSYAESLAGVAAAGSAD